MFSENRFEATDINTSQAPLSEIQKTYTLMKCFYSILIFVCEMRCVTKGAQSKGKK
jgi:hypothetical protein